MPNWTPDNLLAQTGKTYLITGANSGLGYWSSLHLAQHGATILMACRNPHKAEAARQTILQAQPQIQAQQLRLEALDLADLESVRALAERLNAEGIVLDGLLNNAGVMAVPYQKTAQGFEMQLGTNHLGHFALSAQILPLLEKAPAARIVSISSIYHRRGQIHFDDLMGKEKYNKWTAYAQSKLANILFMSELQRRLDAKGSSVSSLAAHPGFASTNLQAAGPKAENSPFKQKLMELASRVLAQSAEQGAYPQLYALTETSLVGGTYWGPNGFKALRGYPVKEEPIAAGLDQRVASRLWQISEELTGQRFL